jgi:hypothetical protein
MTGCCDRRGGVSGQELLLVDVAEHQRCLMLMVAGGDGDGLRFKEEVSCDRRACSVILIKADSSAARAIYFTLFWQLPLLFAACESQTGGVPM